MAGKKSFSQKLPHKVFLILNMVDSAIFNYMMTFFHKKSKKMFIIGFIVSSLALTLGHVGVFMYYKNDNLFE